MAVGVISTTACQVERGSHISGNYDEILVGETSPLLGIILFRC